MKNRFSSELHSANIQWVILNVDEHENKLFNDDYKLYANTVVLSKPVEGKQLNKKNLEDVWDYMNNEEKYGDYLQQEVSKMLQGK